MKNRIIFENLPKGLLGSSHEDMIEYFRDVENPTPYSNLPDGLYRIRGNSKGYRTEYIALNGHWYFYAEYKNADAIATANRYHLFPSLSEKEWEALKKASKYLSPYWRTMLKARNENVACQKLVKEMRLSSYKLNKRNGK